MNIKKLVAILGLVAGISSLGNVKAMSYAQCMKNMKETADPSSGETNRDRAEFCRRNSK